MIQQYILQISDLEKLSTTRNPNIIRDIIEDRTIKTSTL